MKKILLLVIFFSISSQAQLSEGFEGASFPPSTWAVFDNGIGTAQSWGETANAALVYAGAKVAFLNRENVTDGTFAEDWLVTPLVSVPTNGQLRFFTRTTQAGNQGSTYMIKVSTASQTTPGDFTTIQTWDESSLVTTFDQYEQKIISLSTYAGMDIYIAFVMTNDNGDRWLVDNVNVDEECLVQTSQTVTNISDTTVDLGWDNPSNASQWEVEYGPVGFVQGTGTLVTANTNPYTLTGLTAGTQYEFYVRAVCSLDNNSLWIGPQIFSTANCPIANQCNFTFTLTDSFGDGWNGNTMNVTQGGNIIAVLGPTFTTGGGPVNINVPLCDGIPFQLFWNSGGSFAGEVGISVTNPFSDVIYTKPSGSGSQNSLLFTYNVFCTPPTCLQPSNITINNVTTSTVDVGWTDNTGATIWDVEYGPVGFTPGIGAGTIISNVNTNPYTINTLNSGTIYQVYVRAVCSPSDSSFWVGSSSFNTPICDAVDQCNYAFSLTDSFGDGWNGNTMSVRQNGITVATLGPTFTTGSGPLVIQVPLCDGIPFELFWNSGGSFAGEVGISITNPFAEIIYTKPSGTGSQNTLLFSGNVNCTPPTCPKPTNIVLTNSTTTSVDVAWTDNAGATAWEIEYGPIGFTQGTGTLVSAATNPYVLNGLTAGTSYDIYVRAVCSPTDSSEWQGPSNFDTLVCDPSQQCLYSFIMTDSFGDGWNGNTMTISQNGVTLAIIGPTFTTGSGPVTIQVPLCEGIPFQLFWNSGGGFANEVGVQILDPFNEDLYTHAPGTNLQNSILYTGTTSCTPPTCPKPQNLIVSNITQTTADIGWTQIGTETSWIIEYGPIGFNPGTGSFSTANTNPYTLTGLTSGTQYSFYVQADCGVTDGVSTLTGPSTFATEIENDDCANATTVLTNPDLSCTNFASGILIGATASPEPNTCVGTDDDDVWFEFIATSTTHSISLNNISGSTTNLVHVLYEGDICGTLTQLYCSDPNSSNATNLTIGNTYKIRVYSWTGIANQTTAFEVCIGVPPLTIDTTTYTVEELVKDVLIGSECAQVTNITWKTGNTNGFNSTNGIAYFEENYPSLQFTNGIVLTTGDASRSSGPNVVTPSLSDGNSAWTGDAQLQTYIQSLGIDPGLTQYRNATVIEFDFVPLSNQISFDFLFASEEYGTFQCNYSDAFAFFLTDLATNTTTNLAVLPGTNIPISVVTIRDNANNSSCSSENPNYFDVFNGGANAASASTNYNGQTVQLTAQSAVIPQTQYHIKLVIADRNDNSFDSAVFLKGGSFDIGNVDLGDDVLESDGNAICEGDSFVLDSGLSPNQYTFQWTYNGTIIPNETSSTLSLTEEGLYAVYATFNNSTCVATDNITIEFHDPIAAQEPLDLILCTNTGFADFNLESNTTVVLGTLDPAIYSVSYFENFSDATDNINAIINTSNYTNTTINQQTVFVRVYNSDTGCRFVQSFTLEVVDVTPSFTFDSGCIDGSFNIIVEVDNVTNYSYQWFDSSINPIGTNQPNLVVTSPGIYSCEVTNLNGPICSTIQSFNVDATGCLIANGISPNGDGFNDSFDLSRFNVKSLMIFNRYGKEVYSNGDYSNQWRGQSSNGKDLPDGTYYYSMTLDDGNALTGWIYINR